MYTCETGDIKCSLLIHKISFRRPDKITRNIFLILFFYLTSTPSYSQFYEYGQDPGSLRWTHFSSEHYQLIYPRGIDSLAMSFADKLEYYYPHQAEIMDHKHKRLPVVIHNESSFSNGIFVWAPKRLEVFSNPDPNGYPQDWMSQLAIHEGRHAFQVSKLNQGTTRALSFVAGEQAIGLVTGFLPLWYLEGDAVDAETRFSNSGRGRLPSFEMGMKAILAENGDSYPFSKALLGSYKDFIPNHYELGYLMVRYGRRTYGPNFWNDLEDYAARKPYLLAPAYYSMKKYGVRSKKLLYDSTMKFFGEHWNASYLNRPVQEVRSWSNTNDRSYTNYHFPQWVSDSLFLVLKTGIDRIPEFVLIDNAGNEERIFRPGSMNTGRFSYNRNLLVGDEWVPDIRWSNRKYSEIRIYDIRTRKVKSLGAGTRYYTPALSKSGEQIVCIEQNTDHTFFLVILDLQGNVKLKARPPANQYLQHPQWMELDSALVLTLTDDSGEYLYSYSLMDQQWRSLYYSGYNDISYPCTRGKDVYFSSTLSGIDNIYRFDLAEKTLFQVSQAAFGAFEPSVNPGTGEISFSDYHSGGYRAVSIQAGPGTVVPPEHYVKNTEQIDAGFTQKERIIIDGSKDLIKGRYDPSPYRKLFHSINIHSWLPLYFDYLNPEAALTPEELPVKIGASLLTQNLLSTVTGMLGYEYKEKMHYIHSGIRLKGRFPILDMNINYGGLPSVYKINQADNISVDPDRLSFNANIYIPLRLNTGKYITYLQPLFAYAYSSDIFPNEGNNGYVTGVSSMNYRFFASSYLRKSRKDILPRLGFSAYAGYRHAPFNSYNFGNLFNTGLSLYLPGPIKHQSFRLRYSLQIQQAERYLFNNDIPLPRGIKDIRGLEMRLYSADYTFPLIYPDLGLDPVLYLKRVRGNIWCDYMKGISIMISEPQRAIEDRNYLSYGADLLFDFHVFRVFFPFSMGARVAYLPESKEWIPEFLFTIDVN